MLHQQPFPNPTPFVDPRCAAYDRLTRASQQMQKAWLAFTAARGNMRRAQTALDKLEGRSRRRGRAA